jgi:quercetin dioxygenase-like cupin family protein
MKKMLPVSLLGLAVAAAICSLAFAAEEKSTAKSEHVMYSAADLKWGPAPASLPAGAKASVLSGDPGKAGPFTLRLEMPAGYKIPAHTHPTEERITVISGTSQFGMGPKFDDAAAHEVGAGAFIVMPIGMQHFAGSKTGCVVQVDSTGPFEIKYVNPTDDPRQAKK